MTLTSDDALAATLRRELVATLRGNDDLRSHLWEDAVSAAPRHVFLPRFYGTQRPDGTWPLVTPEAVGHPAWLRQVYSDQTWVTQFDGRVADDDDAPAMAIPTSSSTRPGLLIRMLERLDVADGHRLLIVGTGTGYSTALACERLGEDDVVSIDVDPALTTLARARLGTAGYRPTVVDRDGRDGFAGAALYDRVIAFCAFRRPPAAWLRQCRAGAVVVVTITSGLSGFALLRLVVDDDGGATGHVLPDDASFMTARAEVTPSPITLKSAMAPVDQERDTALAPEALRDPDFAFTAQLALSDVFTFRVVDDGGRAATYLQTVDGVSWARVADGRVAYGGPRRLWDELETAHRSWEANGAPTPTRYALTMTPAGVGTWRLT